MFRYHLLKYFFCVITTLLTSTNYLLTSTYSYKEEIYLFNQKPTRIDPNHKIQSKFNFPNLVLNNLDISPIKKKYQTRKVIPKANLD